MSFSQDIYQRAITFAANAHGSQKIPGGNLPYVVHLANVAMEVLAASHNDTFDVDLALTCALLHDVLEDTSTPEEALASMFGQRVASGVRALTKNMALPKEERMGDSLLRIRLEPREIAMVKLADRITNLQEPPSYWSPEKRLAYRDEALLIWKTLEDASVPLSMRLSDKIAAYAAYI